MRKEFTSIVLKLIQQTKHINYVPKDWSSWGGGPINYSWFLYLGWFDVLGLTLYQVSFRHSSVLVYNSQHNTKLPEIYQPAVVLLVERLWLPLQSKFDYNNIAIRVNPHSNIHHNHSMVIQILRFLLLNKWFNWLF